MVNNACLECSQQRTHTQDRDRQKWGACLGVLDGMVNIFKIKIGELEAIFSFRPVHELYFFLIFPLSSPSFCFIPKKKK